MSTRCSLLPARTALPVSSRNTPHHQGRADRRRRQGELQSRRESPAPRGEPPPAQLAAALLPADGREVRPHCDRRAIHYERTRHGRAKNGRRYRAHRVTAEFEPVSQLRTERAIRARSGRRISVRTGTYSRRVEVLAVMGVSCSIGFVDASPQSHHRVAGATSFQSSHSLPGSRVLISWSSHSFPSGSENEA